MQNSRDVNLLLVDAAWPKSGLRRTAILVGVGSLLVAVLAQIEIPLQPVPITGQTFGVLLVGALLGGRLGAITILAYLAWGALGFPVFAGGYLRPRPPGRTDRWLPYRIRGGRIPGWMVE